MKNRKTINATQEQLAKIKSLHLSKQKLIALASAPQALMAWLFLYVTVTTAMDNGSQLSIVDLNRLERLDDPNSIFNHPNSAIYRLFKQIVLEFKASEPNIFTDMTHASKLIKAEFVRRGAVALGENWRNNVIFSIASPIAKLSLNPIAQSTYGYFFQLQNANTKLLTEEEARKLILQLEKQNHLLQLIIKRNTYIARCISFLFIPYSIFKIFFQYDTLNLSNLITLGLAAFFISKIALTNMISDIRDTYNEALFNFNFGKRKSTLIETIPDYIKFSIEEFKESFLDASYVTLSFNFHSKLKIKNNLLAQLVKNSLLEHGISILSYSKTRISVAMNSQLNLNSEGVKKIHNTIDADIQNFIKRKKCNLYFSQLVRSIKKDSIDFSTIPYDDHLKCYVSYELIKNISFDTLKKIFPGCELSKVEGSLEIKAIEACKEDEFQEILKTLNATIKTPHVDTNVYYGDGLDKSLFDIDKFKGKQPKGEGKKTEVIRTQVSKTILPKVEFPSATFDPEDPDCKVDIIKGQGLPRGIFYLTSSLTMDDFPSEGMFKKFNEKVDVCKKANARKNAEGIIFKDRSFKTCDNGDVVPVDGEIKVKGEFGNARMFLTKETRDNKVLYVAVGVKSKTHDGEVKKEKKAHKNRR